MQVRRVDPWSVLKVSLVLSVALFFVWMIAVAFLYLVLGGMGVWSKLNSNVGDLLTATSGGGVVVAGSGSGAVTLTGSTQVGAIVAAQAGKALKKGFDARPVDGARVSSGFGFRRHPILRSIRKHAGIDYAASSGTPIRAAADGKVLDVRRDGGYGNVITLRHANRYDTVYAHMSRFGKFKAGQTVKAGDIIGYVGSTGRSTGPHLHFELRVAGTPVDPTVHALPTPSLSVAQLGKFRTQNVAFQQQMNVVAKLPEGTQIEEAPFRVVVPSFVISELKTAFQIGFMIFIPFLVIDMVVSSVLMSLGMMMLSPVLVALPFKLMLFVLADGWNLLVGSLAASFAT